MTAASSASVTDRNVTVAPTVAYVQGASATTNGAAGSIAQAFTVPNDAGGSDRGGDFLGSNATVTCSDSQGNVYAVATTQYDSTQQPVAGDLLCGEREGGREHRHGDLQQLGTYRRLAIHDIGASFG